MPMRGVNFSFENAKTFFAGQADKAQLFSPCSCSSFS